MINVGLLQEAWSYAQEHPQEYNQASWGYRNAAGSSSETHDLAGVALKLLGAEFVWKKVDTYPAQDPAECVWDCQDVVFSSLPGIVRTAIVEHCTRFTKDIYADYFWFSVTNDHCPIGLAARIALGIDTADSLNLFEEDAKPGEIGRQVQVLLERGAQQWKKLHDQTLEEIFTPTERLTGCLRDRFAPVKAAHA